MTTLAANPFGSQSNLFDSSGNWVGYTPPSEMGAPSGLSTTMPTGNLAQALQQMLQGGGNSGLGANGQLAGFGAPPGYVDTSYAPNGVNPNGNTYDGSLSPEQMAYLSGTFSGDISNPYGMGYAGAMPGNFPIGGFGGYGGYGGAGGAGGNGALAAMTSAYPSLIAAQNQPGIQAGINAANEQVAATSAKPGLLSAQNQIPLANINQATQEYLGRLGLQGQLGVAGINVQPQNTLANAKAGLMGAVQGGLPGLMSALSGQAGGGTSGSGAAGNGGPPPLPSTQFINPELLQQGLTAINNQNATRFGILGTLGKQQVQQGASNGWNTTASAADSVNGIPREEASMDLMRQSALDQANARDWQIGMAQNNAQQANTVGQMAQQQYNAQQQRILDRLGLGLGFVGGLV